MQEWGAAQLGAGGAVGEDAAREGAGEDEGLVEDAGTRGGEAEAGAGAGEGEGGEGEGAGDGEAEEVRGWVG